MTQRRILVLHDDRDASGELAARVVGLGYDLAGAPELVLIVVPGDVDVAAVAEAVRRHHPTPVVAVGTEAAEGRLRDAGVATPAGFVVTPCSDRELRAILELALCRHDAAARADELADYFAISLDMLCCLGFDGRFTRLNPAWERTLGFTREELMSRPFIEFVHPDDRERTLRQNAEVRGGGQARGFENRYRCKDGSYRRFLWNAAPHPAGAVIYSVARDVTERWQADAERTALVRQLEASLAEVRSLRAILPICSYCKKIRDDEDYWHTVESYIERHTATQFTHGICPGCMSAVMEPQLAEFERDAADGGPREPGGG